VFFIFDACRIFKYLLHEYVVPGALFDQMDLQLLSFWCCLMIAKFRFF